LLAGNANPSINNAGTYTSELEVDFADRARIASYQTKPGMRSTDGMTFNMHENFLDDSAIGMSLMGDENDASQYSFIPMNNDSLALNNNNNSQ